MINDRGRVKWAPFLLPEHRDRIAKLYVSEDDVAKPELDEQLLDQLQEIITEAIENDHVVAIEYHQHKRNQSLEGLIKKVDPIKGIICFSTINESIVNIPLHSIINIRKI